MLGRCFQMANWQSSPFGPTTKCGVYAVMVFNPYTHESQIVYIGSAKNIKKRVLNPKHPYRLAVNEVPFPFYVCVKYKECDNYIELEKRLIKRLNPVFNKQFTDKPYRTFKISLA